MTIFGRFAEYGIFRAAERFFFSSTKALEHSHYHPEPPGTGFNPVRSFENQNHARLSAIYGDRLKIIGNGPAVEGHLRDLELLPDSFHNKLVEHFTGHPEGGIYIIDGPVTEVLTDLRGVSPRGWSEGKTWDDVFGAHDPGKRRVVIGNGPGGSISRALPSETFAESLAVWARYRNMSPNYRACKIADALGMHTIDRSQAGALFERYFSSRQRRLEFYST